MLIEGAIFAGYTIERPLGNGGMGEVYLAKHPTLPRRDALKILSGPISADDDYRQRFIREADLAARLFHPDIVRINDRGEYDGQLWIAMDYVAGSDLGSRMRTRYPAGLPVSMVLSVTDAVSSALDYAHTQGVLHRDVKPANILVSDLNGEASRILLSDFGIAREIGVVSGLTATNLAIGTTAYGAPEQLMGQAMDGRADQYALAATVFTLLTGSLPYNQTNPVAVISSHLNAPPPSVGALRPDLAAVDGVIARGMAKDPVDRFPSCTAFATALRQASMGSASALDATMAGPVATSPGQESVRPTTGKFRRVASLGAAVAIILVLVAVAAFVYHGRDRDPIIAGPTLDGVYRLKFDGARVTLNGSEVGAFQIADQTWVFRSLCRKSGCAATAVELDPNNLTAAYPGQESVSFRFADGKWLSGLVSGSLTNEDCIDATGSEVSRNHSVVETLALTASPNGSLQGIRTRTFLTNQCGYQGRVIETPFTAVRTGEVPAGVPLEDPSSVSTGPTPAAPSALTSPLPDGLYRVTWDTRNAVVKFERPTNLNSIPPVLWAVRSACNTTTDCVATITVLNDDPKQKSLADFLVLRYEGGGWNTISPYLETGRATCSGFDRNPTSSITTLNSGQQGGKASGRKVVSFLTPTCGGPGEYEIPFTADRIGDYPVDTVIADPALFLP